MCIHIGALRGGSGGYGVATNSRLLKIIGLFCRISSLLQGSFTKETYNLKEPTTRSHPIRVVGSIKCERGVSGKSGMKISL